MGQVRGFLEIQRAKQASRLPLVRLQDFREIYERPNLDQVRQQASRCMDCGVPFCQSDTGCPVDNLIPEWNDLVSENRWQEAWLRLKQTNNFPEFTGRVCPAPCEGACVLGITNPPVAIKSIECAIADRGYEEGWIAPNPPADRTGRSIAVIGSGPAGLAAADQLNQLGHSVTVYERSDRIGGLLMYGIPNMKLDKALVERRIRIMAEEGIRFKTQANVGFNVSISDLMANHEAILLAIGSTVARDLHDVPGRHLQGIHLAMDYLTEQTQRMLDERDEACEEPKPKKYDAQGKRVVVIGGGDTGTDCIGTAIRNGAIEVINLELMDRPTEARTEKNPWPQWPRVFRTDYGHEEAIARWNADPRAYSVQTVEFLDDGAGHVCGLVVEEGAVQFANGQMKFVPKEGSKRTIAADMVLLALGFVSPQADLLTQMGIERTGRQTINADEQHYATNLPGVYAAGDCRRGQSLVVWAIQEGRRAAQAINAYLLRT